MNEEEIEIDLKELLWQVWKNIWIVVLSAMIGAFLAYIVSSLFIPQKFSSTTKIYVLNQQEASQVTYSDLQTGTQLTKDYAELIVSRTVTSQVIAQLDLKNQYKDMEDITPDILAGMISVSIKNDTRVISITVTDTSPTRAQDIANAVRVAASAHIYDVMDTESVNVVDYANLPEKAISPNLKKNLAIGFIIGGIIAAGIISVIYILDDTIKTPDDVEKYLGLSVLASIPYDENIDTSKEKKGVRKRKQAMPKRVVATAPKVQKAVDSSDIKINEIN